MVGVGRHNAFLLAIQPERTTPWVTIEDATGNVVAGFEAAMVRNGRDEITVETEWDEGRIASLAGCSDLALIRVRFSAVSVAFSGGELFPVFGFVNGTKSEGIGMTGCDQVTIEEDEAAANEENDA